MLAIRTTLFRLSQAEMAEIAGVTAATVSRWETGNLRPSARAVLRLLDAAEAKNIELNRATLLAISEANVKPRPRTSQVAA